MQRFSLLPKEMVMSFWRNRSLLRALVVREVTSRYKGSFLGLLWSLFNPLLMLAVYTFFFSVVFKVRLEGGSGSRIEFAMFLFSGLIIFNMFSECLNRAPTLILFNPNYVKKIVFPVELLPWVVLASAIFQLVISYLVWLAFYLIFFGLPHIASLLLPLVLLPLCLISLGLGWILSSLGVFLRDVQQVVITLTPILMFLSPVFYRVSALPENYRLFIRLNPVTPAVEMARSVMFWGDSVNWPIWGVYSLAAFVFAWVGFVWFQCTRTGFADVV